MSDGDPRLTDRIINYMRTEQQRLRQEWAAEGLRPGNYSVAIEVNRVAEDLDVSPLSVNAALGHLHRGCRVVGYRIAREKDHPSLYAIALDERAVNA